MSYLVLFFVVSAIFLVADAIMLRSVIQPLFAKHLGDALYEGGFRLLPALLFYVILHGGVLYFASLPALRADAPSLAASERGDPRARGLWHLRVHLLGRHAGTGIRRWSPMDLAWGTVLTGGRGMGRGDGIARAIAG
jgi:uncharacterized membrane protein